VKQAAAKKILLEDFGAESRVKDVVLIVECGGATVDRQAYELTSASPCSFPKFALSSGRHLQVRSSPPPLCVFHWVGLIAITVKPVVLRHFANVVHTRLRKMAFTCRLKGLLAGLMLCNSIVEFHRRIKVDFRNAG
jgi:hypothetical protein